MTPEECCLMMAAEREAFPLICMTAGRCRTKRHKAQDAEALRMDRRQSRSHRRRAAREGGEFYRGAALTALGFDQREASPVDERTLQRFLSKVNKNGPVVREELGPCWIWTGALSGRAPHQYGFMRLSQPRRMAKAHRLAHEHWIGRIPDGLVVLHSCDVSECVRPDHLSSGTLLENSAQMRERDRSGRGIRHPMAKLSEIDVLEIRQRCARGEVQKRVAKSFGITHQTVSKIALRKSWGHL